MDISGQWMARYSGSNSGTLVLGIDDRGDHYEGTACAWDNNPDFLNSLVRFTTRSKENTQSFDGLQVIALDNSGNLLTPETLQKIRDQHGMDFPATVDVQISLANNSLNVSWKSSIGTSGSALATLPKTRANQKSELVPLPINTWDEFKSHVAQLARERYVYRGHRDNSWRLRSSFFRHRRSNLDRYVMRDMPELNKALSSSTRNIFDLNNQLHYGAFISLAQHHGYPTPLLDWTWSPYVAAFFAFRDIPKYQDFNPANKVRILKFDVREWIRLPQVNRIFPALPHVSILDPLAFENNRAIPQQSVTTISNVDDIEAYIAEVEKAHGKKYLEVIDLPWGLRNNVMGELALMGITAGALFPGFDGACESLREKNF